MRLPTIAIAITSFCLLGFGLLMLFAPEAGFRMLTPALEPALRAEIRSFYGGLELALGALMARALFNQNRQQSLFALELGGACFAAVALSRTYGMLVDQTSHAWHLVALPIEVALSLLCWLAWQQLRRGDAAA